MKYTSIGALSEVYEQIEVKDIAEHGADLLTITFKMVDGPFNYIVIPCEKDKLNEKLALYNVELTVRNGQAFAKALDSDDK